MRCILSFVSEINVIIVVYLKLYDHNLEYVHCILSFVSEIKCCLSQVV